MVDISVKKATARRIIIFRLWIYMLDTRQAMIPMFLLILATFGRDRYELPCIEHRTTIEL